MKKTAFARTLTTAWKNAAQTISAINEIKKSFERGTIPAAKARREYARLHRALVIDGTRYVKILVAAQNYDRDTFRYWTAKPLYEACGSFRNYFGY